MPGPSGRVPGEVKPRAANIPTDLKGISGQPILPPVVSQPSATGTQPPNQSPVNILSGVIGQFLNPINATTQSAIAGLGGGPPAQMMALMEPSVRQAYSSTGSQIQSDYQRQMALAGQAAQAAPATGILNELMQIYQSQIRYNPANVTGILTNPQFNYGTRTPGVPNQGIGSGAIQALISGLSGQAGISSLLGGATTPTVPTGSTSGNK